MQARAEPQGATQPSHRLTNVRPPVQVPGALSPADVERYRQAFDLQERGDFAGAERVAKQVHDRILMGYVLRERFLRSKQRATWPELKAWLDAYHDLPDADRVYALAISRKPRKEPAPHAATYGDEAKRAVEEHPAPPLDEQQRKQNQLLARVTSLIRDGQAPQAETLLYAPASRELLTTVQFDRALADVAMGWFIKGQDEHAYQLAAAAAARSGDAAAQGHWVAGVAAVRLNDLPRAARHFEAYAQVKDASPWNVAAGAFWAARMHLLNRQPALVDRWLRIAADQPRTFYGLLARRALGVTLALDWRAPLIGSADVARVQALPGGRRALALVQVGRIAWADQELYPSVNGADPMTARSMMAVADYSGMPNTSARSALRLLRLGAMVPDSAAYPIPPWRPDHGFELDRALLYAFMRQESLFNTRATSWAGARGLMQLMPATAVYIANGAGLEVRDTAALSDPEYNLALGQAYLSYLMKKSDVAGDLFKLAAAYNGGIGNVRRWLREVKHLNDPLMFIESLPARETRIFVMRVLSNYWIYRNRLGQPTPSLDQVAAGEWPRYSPADGNDTMVAQDAGH